MDKIQRLILENQRMLLWENWRKYFISCGAKGCVESNEIEEQVGKINDLLKDSESKEPCCNMEENKDE